TPAPLMASDLSGTLELPNVRKIRGSTCSNEHCLQEQICRQLNFKTASEPLAFRYCSYPFFRYTAARRGEIFMRVLLVQPPLTPAREVQPPVGLCTLASWLIKLGHQVQILDLDLEIKHRPADEQDAYSRLFVDSLTHFHPEVVGV